jgi:hypothetical protein
MADNPLESMRETERRLLLEIEGRSLCPFCGQHVKPESRIGTGSKASGVFCSLNCFAEYSVLELSDRILGVRKHLAADTRN